MHNAATALFILSSVVSLLGGHLRDRFVCTDERPTDVDTMRVFRVQRRLCIGFFVVAGLGLAFATMNALAFAIFRLSDADVFWTATMAGTWSVVVATLFVATYGAMQKAKTMSAS